MKNIIITGASTGIGYSTTKALINRGHRVFGSVRKESDAKRLKDDFGTNFEPLIFDVTNPESVQQEAQRIEAMIGHKGVYALINNAGIGVAGPLMHLPIEDLRWQMEVNVIGLLTTTQAFLPLLGAKKDCPHPPGRILNISSVAGKIANPFMGPYAASKHAVEALSKSLRTELQLYGIDVIVIGPGVVKTPIWEKAEEVSLDAYKHTDYGKSSERFLKFVLKVSNHGFEQEDFGKKLADIVEAKKPKARYAMVYNKFYNWVLPLYMPIRMLDKIIGKRLGLIKK